MAVNVLRVDRWTLRTVPGIVTFLRLSRTYQFYQSITYGDGAMILVTILQISPSALSSPYVSTRPMVANHQLGMTPLHASSLDG